MRKFLFPTQDATIYERYPTYNAGVDEILEVGKLKASTDQAVVYSTASARILIEFDLSDSGSLTSASAAYLNLYIAASTNVYRYQSLEIYPISRSWIEGSGYRYQDVKNVEDGVTWNSAAYLVDWAVAGGDYVTSPTSSYELSQYPIIDMRIDVSDIILDVISGSNTVPWNGMLIKYPLADELSSLNTGNIKLFSANTHTIFSPTLELVWDDQVFNTGSLKPIPNGNVSIIPKNIKEEYTSGEIDKIYFVVRDPYPDRKFDSTQRYRNQYYLPSESYYRIIDEVSGIALHDFDSYSAINCDPTGSYILLDTSGFNINRYYRLDLKVKSGNLVFFPETVYTFKVDSNG